MRVMTMELQKVISINIGKIWLEKQIVKKNFFTREIKKNPV